MSFRVQYKRTSDWWNGRWQELAEWCDNTFGDGNWDWNHMSQEFLFNTESDKMFFMLRWK